MDTGCEQPTPDSEVRNLCLEAWAGLSANAAVFARVEGLGRIPFANLRRPKPLMDTGSEQLTPDGQVQPSVCQCWGVQAESCVAAWGPPPLATCGSPSP